MLELALITFDSPTTSVVAKAKAIMILMVIRWPDMMFSKEVAGCIIQQDGCLACVIRSKV